MISMRHRRGQKTERPVSRNTLEPKAASAGPAVVTQGPKSLTKRKKLQKTTGLKKEKEEKIVSRAKAATFPSEVVRNS